MSSFTYVQRFSNIPEMYKHAVVPYSLFRIHTRNSLQEDIDHHLSFLYKILKFRMQDPSKVRSKTIAFFKKKKKGDKHKKSPYNSNFRNLPVMFMKFDQNSKRHIFMSKLIRNNCKSKIRMIYKSGSSLASLICPKRRIIRQLSKLCN